MLRKRANSKMKILSRAIVLLMLTALLTGCDSDVLNRKVVFTTGFSDSELFRIEDSSCSLTEASVYLLNTQNGYEDTFGKDIWGAQTDDGTVEDRLKESVLAKLAQIKVMNLLALENGIELDETELRLVASAADEYYDSLSEADIRAMNNVTRDEIEEIYRQHAVADKLYDYIIRDINPEISDDEARTITVEQILIKTYSLDENGEKVPYTSFEKDAAHMRIREIYKKLMNEESSFEELMAEYNEADESTIFFGKGEMENAYDTAAFNLGTEEISGIVETENGYVIIKCISTFNREETEANKVKIVEERKREVFGAQYDAFVTTLTKELNEKLWDRITLMDDPEATTKSFMEVYDKYF